MPHPPEDLIREFERRAADVRVLVVGDIMLDVYLDGSASRISPEAPVPVVLLAGERRALGGAANVAANVRALGAACALAGCVGVDDAGDGVAEELERAGIEAAGVVRDRARPTSVKHRIMVRGQQVARYDRETDLPLDGGTERALIERIASLAGPVHAVAIEDYDKGVLTQATIDAALAFAAERGVPSVVDPKARNFFAYGGASVFKPNRAELEAALREPVQPDDPGWLDGARRRLDCACLLVTLGEAGMAIATGQPGGAHRIPTVARSVYDVSGAGDTVVAVLATALGAGFGVEDAAALANQAAGVQVGKAGVATVSVGEIAAAAEHGRSPAAGPRNGHDTEEE